MICALHSDILSLYCEKDKNLLCVSCLFESDYHSKHTVVPLKAAIPSIASDSVMFRTRLRERITVIDADIKRCITNRSLLENSLEKSLDLLNKEFHALKNIIN